MFICHDNCLFNSDKISFERNRTLLGGFVLMNNKEHPDTVSYGVYEQVAWERDLVEDQLNTLGFGVGSKVTCRKKLVTTYQKDGRYNIARTFEVCSECGEQLHSDINFCPYCGRKILDG